MKTKRFLGLALASTLALSMSIPAFAAPGADDGSGSGTPVTPVQENNKLSFDYSSETWTQEDVIIDVSMPTATSGNIILNPYKLGYVGQNASGADEVQYNPVVSGKYNYVENNSTFPIDVAWEITGSVTGDVVLVEKAPSTTSTTKDVYLPIKLGSVKAKTSATASDTVPAANIDTKLKAVTTATQASTDKTVVVLDASNATSGAGGNALHSDGTNPEKQSFLCFGIEPYTESSGTYSSGATLNNNKAKLTEDWTAEDTVSVSMIFTFTPHA